VQHLFSLFFVLSKDFLRGVEHFPRRGTISWNNLCVVEQPGPARLWNIFRIVEHFRGTISRRGTIFFQKKGLTLFFF